MTREGRGALDAHERSIVLEEGTILAQKYRLTRTAGFGGMAQLWVATNQATGAEVCIKILVPETSDGEAVERFRREAHAAARLSHRAIVRIFDLVELGVDGEVITSGQPTALAIVMELLHGETLGDFLMKRGKVPLEEAIDLTLPFLSALAHAHRAGVIHRDLKPDNIFLATDPDGHTIPKVLDFGVSKMFGVGELGARSPDAKPLTVDGVMLGTPSYMSPEQARGARNIDARSDVFSAGILFYMMLAGRNPFESESFHSVISAILERDPARLTSVPDEIWDVLAKALAKDMNDRFADATELGIALRHASGRSSTTDSGVHSAASIPSRMRIIVPPLGGDSHVTVPPAGSEEDGSGDANATGATPAARRRAVKIVVAAVGASVALTVVALLRGPAGSSGTTNAGTTSAQTAQPAVSLQVLPGAAESAPVAPAPVVSPPPGPAVIVPSPAVPAPVVPAPVVPAPLATAARLAVDAGPARLPPPAASDLKSEPVPSVKKEPAIVRDPGF